jgi:glyoxylase-like metal-dependent hydrolase (beta-lactamase superfamily II)
VARRSAVAKPEMVEEVVPDIFRMEIPLPRNPLRAINSYVVRGRDRFLMIDTGMNRPECLDVMRASLKALAVDLGRTDFFVTHCHSDHVGLVSALKTGPSKVFLNPADAALILNSNLWAEMADAAHTHGFPDPDTAVEKHPGRRYLFSGHPEFTYLREGDTLPIGHYVFRCVETPGHTPGHLCLYESEARIFFSGDHILDTITPNISGWGREADPLGEFLESLDKIAAYDIKVILPGHRNLILDHRRRIAELKAHHRVRMQEVVDILARERQTAYQIASRMTWNIDCARWEEFPVPQKWFATGEALAHLLHLERTGRIQKSQGEGKAYFSLSLGAGGDSTLR